MDASPPKLLWRTDTGDGPLNYNVSPQVNKSVLRITGRGDDMSLPTYTVIAFP